jgi:hypothetical protein
MSLRIRITHIGLLVVTVAGLVACGSGGQVIEPAPSTTSPAAAHAAIAERKAVARGSTSERLRIATTHAAPRASTRAQPHTSAAAARARTHVVAPPPPRTSTHHYAPKPSPKPTPTPKPKPVSNCTPGYSPCVPIASDVDCAGGSGNGPAYVEGPIYVTGDDPYDLDRDGNGIACEDS